MSPTRPLRPAPFACDHGPGAGGFCRAAHAAEGPEELLERDVLGGGREPELELVDLVGEELGQAVLLDLPPEDAAAHDPGLDHGPPTRALPAWRRRAAILEPLPSKTRRAPGTKFFLS